MNSLIEIGINLFLTGVSIVVWYYSLKYLNNCTAVTRFPKRVSYIMYFTGSTGTLVLLLSQNPVDWSYGLFITASAFHLISEKRSTSRHTHSIHSLQHGKH